MSDYILSLDNGTGSTGIAMFGPNDLVRYEKFPTKSTINYQKEEQHITRVDVPALRILLVNWNIPKDTIVLLERPLINPTRFKASISAARCFEATIIVLEELGLDYKVVDSKAWQRVLLPNIEGSNELKKASLELGKKLFPNLKLKKDADSLLIGYWAKNKDKLETIKPIKKKIKL
jgi:hypothetical protein